VGENWSLIEFGFSDAAERRGFFVIHSHLTGCQLGTRVLSCPMYSYITKATNLSLRLFFYFSSIERK
jgi:hypothetical protein